MTIQDDMLNEDTKSRGNLPPRTIDESLARTAQELATNMANGAWAFSHSSGGGMSFRAGKQGWAGQSLAENIAEGNATPEATFRQWMNSPSHRANILGDYDYAGFGHAVAINGDHYWAADYGSRGSGGGRPIPGRGGIWRWIRGWLGFAWLLSITLH